MLSISIPASPITAGVADIAAFSFVFTRIVGIFKLLPAGLGQLQPEELLDLRISWRCGRASRLAFLEFLELLFDSSTTGPAFVRSARRALARLSSIGSRRRHHRHG